MEPDFDVQPRLTQITMALRPMDFIADIVLPRVMSPLKFSITKNRPDEAYSIPQTRIGRTGVANRIETGADDTTYTCEDHGLEDPVPVSDRDWAQSQMAAWDPYDEATINVASGLYLAREQRVANLVFGLNSYAATLRETLSGTDQWSDYVNSNPRKAILKAMDKMLIRPNTAIFGQTTWTDFRQHPKVVASVRATDAEEGAISRSQAAELLEMDNVFVGATQHNSAAKGLAGSYSRLWGRHFAMIYLNPMVTSSTSKLTTFGFTAEFEGMVTGTYHEARTGVKGADVVKTIDRIREVVTENLCGYFFQNAVAA